MENCFRFLINVDQCLNMSHFDIFFYKLESRHKYHLNQVRLFGNSAGTTLRNAAVDIRMYLDKYPYHVGDCQITVAMRSQFRKRTDVWEETMLYRLLQLNLELRRARIYINSRERMEKALNLIMLYDADFAAELPQLGDYMSGGRFRDDCVLMLQTMGFAGEYAGQEELEGILDAYRAGENFDPAAADTLERFLKTRDAHDDVLLQDEETAAVECSGKISVLAELMPFIKDQLANFQVFEAQIDRNNRRQNILALLRVVEFVNMSVERPAEVDDTKSVITLSQRCAQNWKTIWSDPNLEQRYANMLRRYQHRLHLAADDLERSGVISASAQKLPEEKIPEENAIVSTDNIFSNPDPNKQGSDLRKILDGFLRGSFSIKTVRSEWSAVYKRIKGALERMDHELKVYAEGLSRQYAVILEERKRDTVAWKNNYYTAEKDTENDIHRLEYEREQLLQKLKSPHMNPSLNFQDQLNMENSLEQGNLNIEFLLNCLSTVTAANFLGLVGLCALLCFLHYTVLQPYALQGVNTLMYYLLYLAAVLVLMLLCWALPYQHFRKKLKACIRSLQRDMDTYISGYFKKAEYFCEYINLLNRLDYINRYHRLLLKAYDASHRLSQGYLWHKVQVREHLAKLQFFQGLIDIGEDTKEDAADHKQSLPNVEGERVSDVIDSPIYWPQA